MKNTMSNFNIKKIKDKDFMLYKNDIPYTTNNGNNILLPYIIKKKQFIKKLNIDFDKKESIFFKILFYSADIDKNRRDVLEKKILNYIDTDLICYREKIGSELEKLQREKWDSYLNFCKNKFLLDFKLNYSLMPFTQKKTNHKKITKLIKKMNPHYITSFFFLVELTNSIIISLNIFYNNINIDDAWEASNLEYSYNQKKWGIDKELKSNLLLKKNLFNDIINYIMFFSKE